MAFRSGAFTGWYAPASSYSGSPTFANIGATEDGYHQRTIYHEDEVKTDYGGDMSVDGVLRGQTEEISLVWCEYNLIIPIMTAHQGTMGAGYTNQGKLSTAVAGPLVLVPKAGTPAETELTTGKSIIFYKAKLVTDVDQILANRLRKGNLTFRCFPDTTLQNLVWNIIATPGSTSHIVTP